MTPRRDAIVTCADSEREPSKFASKVNPFGRGETECETRPCLRSLAFPWVNTLRAHTRARARDGRWNRRNGVSGVQTSKLTYLFRLKEKATRTDGKGRGEGGSGRARGFDAGFTGWNTELQTDRSSSRGDYSFALRKGRGRGGGGGGGGELETKISPKDRQMIDQTVDSWSRLARSPRTFTFPVRSVLLLQAGLLPHKHVAISSPVLPVRSAVAAVHRSLDTRSQRASRPFRITHTHAYTESNRTEPMHRTRGKIAEWQPTMLSTDKKN